MATVHLGKQIGEVGFSRTVAIKRLHENFVRHPQFVAMMIDEARLVSRIRHPNVVPTLDIVSLDGELFVVMEYVHGASLSSLLSKTWEEGLPMQPAMAAAIMLDVLHGLHAAHEAKSERGAPLGIVHRDVSPQNVLVGVDGIARVLDFGIAKAAGRIQSTSTGQIKGKLAYMAPEQMRASSSMDRRVDVYAAGIVLWELLAGCELFSGDNDAQTMYNVLHAPVEPPSAVASGIAPALDEVVMKALDHDPDARFPTAQDFAVALEAAISPIPRAREVGAWVVARAGASLEERAAQVASVEARSGPWKAAPVIALPPMPDASAAAPSRPEGETGVPATVSYPRAPSSPRHASTSSDAVPGWFPPAGTPSNEVPGLPRRGRLGLYVGGVGVLVAGGMIALLIGRRDPVPPPPSAASAPVSPPSVRTRDTAASEPSAPTPDAPVATASTSTPPSVAATAARPTIPHPRTPSCNPPFTIDATGVKIPKRHCFDAGARGSK